MGVAQQILLGNTPISAGISVGNTTSIGNGVVNSSTLIGDHTVLAGSNRILVVAVPESRSVSITSVTYNGVSLTVGPAVTYLNNSARLFYLLSPPVGTYSVQVNYSTSNAYYICGVIDLSGVSQSSPIGATNTAVGFIQNKTITITTTIANSYLIECFGDQGTTNTPASGQTYISNGANRSSAYSSTTTVGSYTKNWTGDLTSDYSYLIAEIKPA